MKAKPKPSPRYSEYVRKIKCGEWSVISVSGHTATIRHAPTGKTAAYQTHDGGNDRNSARNFAAEVQRICGCRLIEPRGRKRSRKNFLNPPSRSNKERRAYEAEVRRRDRLAQETERRKRKLNALKKEAADLEAISDRAYRRMTEIAKSHVDSARVAAIKDPSRENKEWFGKVLSAVRDERSRYVSAEMELSIVREEIRSLT